MKPTIETLTALFGELLAPRATPSFVVSPSGGSAAPKLPESGTKPQTVPATTSAATPAEVAPAGSGLKPELPRPSAQAAAGASAATAAPSAPPAEPIQATNRALKGYDLDITVAPDQVVLAAAILDRERFALDTITGVDWLAQNQMEIVYDYFHPTESLRLVVRTRIPRAEPELPTISKVFPGANWHERETHDFFGIRFSGHPNLSPFLLPEDADFHPLRKDYQP